MNMNFIVFIFSLEICHILSDRYALKESDLTVEVENIEKKNVYLLLNLDGSLPMPGKIKSLSVKKKTIQSLGPRSTLIMSKLS